MATEETTLPEFATEIVATFKNRWLEQIIHRFPKKALETESVCKILTRSTYFEPCNVTRIVEHFSLIIPLASEALSDLDEAVSALYLLLPNLQNEHHPSASARDKFLRFINISETCLLQLNEFTVEIFEHISSIESRKAKLWWFQFEQRKHLQMQMNVLIQAKIFSLLRLVRRIPQMYIILATLFHDNLLCFNDNTEPNQHCIYN